MAQEGHNGLLVSRKNAVYTADLKEQMSRRGFALPVWAEGCQNKLVCERILEVQDLRTTKRICCR